MVSWFVIVWTTGSFLTSSLASYIKRTLCRITTSLQPGSVAWVFGQTAPCSLRTAGCSQSLRPCWPHCSALDASVHWSWSCLPLVVLSLLLWMAYPNQSKQTPVLAFYYYVWNSPVLGHLLFLIYYKDIPSVASALTALFADDTLLFHPTCQGFKSAVHSKLTWMRYRLGPSIWTSPLTLWNLLTSALVIIPVLTFSKSMVLSSRGALKRVILVLFSLWICDGTVISIIYSLLLLALSTSKSSLTSIDCLLSLFVVFTLHSSVQGWNIVTLLVVVWPVFKFFAWKKFKWELPELSSVVREAVARRFKRSWLTLTHTVVASQGALPWSSLEVSEWNRSSRPLECSSCNCDISFIVCSTLFSFLAVPSLLVLSLSVVFLVLHYPHLE